MKNILNVGVLGGGSFGTALGTVAARCGHNVKMLSKTLSTVKEINEKRQNTRFFPENIVLPENLKASSEIIEVLKDVDMIIHAIPVQASYDFIKENLQYIPENVPYLIASKGILLKQKKFFSQTWDELFGKKKIPHCILSGPSFAIEIMKEYPTVVSLGCKDKEVAKFVQNNLSIDSFRIYTTTDVIGVEIGGALKNPLAIAAGMIEGYGYSYNTVSAMVTRGIYEISLFSEKFGGKTETLYGLSGIGDVMLSCLGTLSRNKAVGYKLAQGQKLEDIIKNNTEVAEGIPTLLILGEIIKEYNLNMPIMSTLYRIVTGEIPVDEARKFLMLRELEDELGLQI
jgi:glycerol-3-phosphate dehydrogenase (NAD(P)+)